MISSSLDLARLHLGAVGIKQPIPQQPIPLITFSKLIPGTGVARARTRTLVFGFFWWLPLARRFERGEEPPFGENPRKQRFHTPQTPFGMTE
jgi:hypothetical protein